ncbi:uncharacterized protein LOC107475069 [Arachis duranensis]|uniref:Uncharacterized protein LOC107475069 n=1 Tax=Arachis duranensis TaxID=130453 RepID=A0A6P4CF58_ARADU|nr:uncharacterized protein LOC107475069 [Arachis duranensis]
MTKLTRKETPFGWTSECEESFQTLKQKLTSAPVSVLLEPHELSKGMRRWMELLKDYDSEMSYHRGKAKVVADALSRRCRKSLFEPVTDFNARLRWRIQKAQQDERKLQELFQPVGDKRCEHFTKDGEGLWRYKGRICIPDVGSGIQVCACQKAKIEHQKQSEMIQPLEIPQWKWEGIATDFVTGLLKTRLGVDAVWVIMVRLDKSAHFLPIRVNYSLEELDITSRDPDF